MSACENILEKRNTNSRHNLIKHYFKKHPSELKKIDKDGTIIHKLLTNRNYRLKTLIHLIKLFPEGLSIKDDLGQCPIHYLVKLDFDIDIECILKLMLTVNPDMEPDNEGNYPLHIYLKRIKIMDRKRESNHCIEVIEMLSTRQSLTSYNKAGELPIHIICKANHLNDYWIQSILTVLINICPETLLMESNSKYPVELLSTINCDSIIQCLRVRLPQEIIIRIIKNVWENTFECPLRKCYSGTAILLYKLNTTLVKDLRIDNGFNTKILTYYNKLNLKHNILLEILDSECCLEKLGIIKEAIGFAIKPDRLLRLQN